MKVRGLRRLIYIKSVAIIYLKKNLPSKLVYFSPFKNKPSTFESPLFLLLRSNNLNTINKPKKRLLLRTARTILFDRRQARLTFPMQHQKSPDRKSNLPSLTRLLSPPLSKQKKRKKGRRRGEKKNKKKEEKNSSTMQNLYTPRRAAVGAGKVVRPVGPGATRAQTNRSPTSKTTRLMAK